MSARVELAKARLRQAADRAEPQRLLSAALEPERLLEFAVERAMLTSSPLGTAARALAVGLVGFRATSELLRR